MNKKAKVKLVIFMTELGKRVWAIDKEIITLTVPVENVDNGYIHIDFNDAEDVFPNSPEIKYYAFPWFCIPEDGIIIMQKPLEE